MSTRAYRVLVVDDDPWTLKALSAVISADRQLEVSTANSGSSAVLKFKEWNPDVVLMDINMPPGISGIEATSEIVLIDASARIIILTTVAPGPGLAHALMAGAMAAVSKGAPEETIVQVVKLAAKGEVPIAGTTLANDILLSGDLDMMDKLPIPVLTPRERDILNAVCSGLGYVEIARLQHIEVSTVRVHARNLRLKLNASNMAQLIVRALQFRFFVP